MREREGEQTKQYFNPAKTPILVVIAKISNCWQAERVLKFFDRVVPHHHEGGGGRPIWLLTNIRNVLQQHGEQLND